MTRKSVPLLLCLAQLALLTGCQHVPRLSGGNTEGKKLYESTPTNATDSSGNNKLQSKAGGVEQVSPAWSVDVMSRTREASPLAVAPLGVTLPTQNQVTKSPAPKNGGIGLLTLEMEPKTSAPKASDPPALPTLVQKQRDYAPLVLALQCMLDKRHEDAIQQLRAYDEETQQFFLRLLPALVVFVQKPIGELTAQEIAVLTNQLDRVNEELRKRSALVICKTCYCKRVYGFGSYVTLPDNHAFLAATPDRPGELVQLYVELKNFASEREAGKDGDFLTKLSCTLELRDARGEKVWAHPYDKSETTQRRRTRLTDLHGNYSFYVPALPAGTYQLRVQVVDETLPDLRRVAESKLDFRVTPVASPTPR